MFCEVAFDLEIYFFVSVRAHLFKFQEISEILWTFRPEMNGTKQNYGFAQLSFCKSKCGCGFSKI